jgi:hypothetical protein
MHVIDWLLDGDPAIRWQVCCEISKAPLQKRLQRNEHASSTKVGVRACSRSRIPTGSGMVVRASRVVQGR